MKHVVCILAAALAACGGGAAPRAPEHDEARGPGSAPRDSIGEAAAAQGGLAALGGAGNREEGATGVELALQSAFHIDDVDHQAPVKLDGLLKEWPARHPAQQALSGKTDGLALGVALQADDGKLYVGVEITDRSLARSAAHGAGDDHVVMSLAFPSGRGGLAPYEIAFFPGKPGESGGAVRWAAGPSRGQDVAGAKLVEADTKNGVAFEAVVPWSAFPEARIMRVGLRGAFRYLDGDGTRTAAVLATGPGSAERPSELQALPGAAEQAVVDGLLGPKNLAGTAPRIDVFADVAGDERKERISVFGSFFTICGPGYRGGKQFFWREVAGELASFETRDLTGRGKDDMIVRRRSAQAGVTRELLEVWTVASGDEPVTLFTQEISVSEPSTRRRVANAVRVSGKEIEVSVEPAQGWDASTFKEPALGEEGILLPWGAVRSRTFRLEKGRFVKSGEVAQAAAAGVAPSTAAAPASTRELPFAPVGASSDLSRQVMDLYLKDQGVAPGTRPRFDIEVHVDGDPRPERVALVGRDIVVLGPGFKGGTGYARLTLTQFTDDKDIHELTARDVTGDGAAELVVRGVRRVTTPANETVAVESLFICQVKGGAISRVFAIETGRELAGKRVQGSVQLVPARSGKGFDVDVRPGVARGWTKASYPWPQDRPGGAIEPLLLPWSGVSGARYTWNGTTFTQ
ncbi:MAG: hypothetical protein JWP97_2583 [Labilithrix sp.]|nr:hypothetical protein [Labilithrix sp.]